MREIFRNEADLEEIDMEDKILKIISEYMQEEELLNSEEARRFQKIWRREC